MKAIVTIIILIVIVGGFIWYYQSSAPSPVSQGDTNAAGGVTSEVTATDVLNQIVKDLEKEKPIDVDGAFRGAEAALKDL